MNVSYSKELKVNGNVIYIGITNGNGNNKCWMDRVVGMIFECYDAMKEMDGYVFPRVDVEVVFEFGTDPSVYDCIMGVNFDRTENGRYIVESSTPRVLEELSRKQYKRYHLPKTDFYKYLRHEMQHIKNGKEIMKFHDRIDSAVVLGNISLNEAYQSIALEDLKFDGVAETIEHGCRSLNIRSRDMSWFRKKFDGIPKVNGKNPEELNEKLEKYYERMIRMQNSEKIYLQDNYTNGRYIFYIIAAANNGGVNVQDKSGNAIKAAIIGSEIQNNGLVRVEMAPEKFMGTYEFIESIDIDDFFEECRNAWNALGIPEHLRAVDAKTVGELLQKLK
ncbi:MAG: hypothetical protein V1900_03010 [Candidatus Aenigmatarchaeota archaeon]